MRGPRNVPAGAEVFRLSLLRRASCFDQSRSASAAYESLAIAPLACDQRDRVTFSDPVVLLASPQIHMKIDAAFHLPRPQSDYESLMRLFVRFLFLLLPLIAAGQTLTVDNDVQTYASL